MKNNKFIIQFLIAGGLVISTFTACQKDYFDINQNPNSPADATVVDLLPSAEAAIAHVVGNNFQIFGGIWGQHWTQSPSSSQYKTIEQYSPAANDFDRPWKALYADALEDLVTINSKVALQPQNANYGACAKILEAYTFQLLTDNFGDVPFSEALQGNNGLLYPKYDSQRDIYIGIIKLLNDGLAMINDDPTAIVPGQEDLLKLTAGGDMSLWRKFGNTLKLRVFLRLSYVNPTMAQDSLAAMETNGDTYLGAGEEVKIDYLNSGGNTNPLFAEMSGLNKTQNLVGSATALNFLNDNNDPRVDAFYSPAANGSQVGIPQGAYTLPAGTLVSIPGSITGGNASTAASAASAVAPVKLMTGYESLFLQAEAAARGWLSGNAQSLYEDGITENFVSYGFTSADAATYFAQDSILFPAGTPEQNIRAIITQKWIAMCGNQCDEAWIEWRRTGYPDFFSESVNSIIGAGHYPERFFYPTSEVTRNNHFPGQKLIYEKVWWDVN